MAYDYAIVHLKYTIPLAVLLTGVAYPILNRVHFYQILALIVIAFTATLPWDSHLIKTGVWTYPSEVVIGPKWLGIPYEELFFFIIQTYITSLIYILFNQPLLHAQYLKSQRNAPTWINLTKLGGGLILAGLSALGGYLAFGIAGEFTYLGLILVWACPFALITWILAGKFIISLPWMCTVLPVLLPTTYLWLVDELALGRGTWSIESGTKLGRCLFGVLEIEEATFFLVTNMLIVFGLATFDQYLAVIYSFPHLFPEVPQAPSPLMLLQGRFKGTSSYDMERIRGIKEAVIRLKAKSRSFYFASSVFTGRLRIDLVLLYSFCRMADDLIDDATTHEEMMTWVTKLYRFLDFYYDRDATAGETTRRKKVNQLEVDKFIVTEFPPSAKSALKLLPTDILPGHPLYLLIDGFKMDAQFRTEKNTTDRFPIKEEKDLIQYSLCVAGTIGELCVSLIVYHFGSSCSPVALNAMLDASRQMGIALQYVNIARDIQVDAKIGRVYLPMSWLKEVDLTPEKIIQDPLCPETFMFRERLLDEAFRLWTYARPLMNGLPDGGRGPMVVAVENYMEIGRILRENPRRVRTVGKATVPVSRRAWVTIKALISA